MRNFIALVLFAFSLPLFAKTNIPTVTARVSGAGQLGVTTSRNESEGTVGITGTAQALAGSSGEADLVLYTAVAGIDARASAGLATPGEFNGSLSTNAYAGAATILGFVVPAAGGLHANFEMNKNSYFSDQLMRGSIATPILVPVDRGDGGKKYFLLEPMAGLVSGSVTPDAPPINVTELKGYTLGGRAIFDFDKIYLQAEFIHDLFSEGRRRSKVSGEIQVDLTESIGENFYAGGKIDSVSYQRGISSTGPQDGATQILATFGTTLR